MNTIHALRIAPLAAALLLGGSLLAGCSKDNADAPPSDSTAANSPVGNTAPATPGATTGMDNGMNDTTGGATATTSDNTAMADTTMAPGSAMDNTAAGTTVGDMNTPGAATPATTSADASAMGAGAAAASGAVTASTFYSEALAGGAEEIAASRLAQKNGGDAVDEVAAMIIADHTAMADKIKAAAGKAASAPPPADTAMLDGKTGADLDRAYADQMVSDHQKAIAMFENASTHASTDEAKKLASAALPKLRKHLEAAQKLQQSLK
jgi:putative membrane protein